MSAISTVNLELPLLHDFILKVGKNQFEGTLLAFDPGETTGLTKITHLKNKTVLWDQEQIASWPLEKFVQAYDTTQGSYFSRADVCVYEAYHVYSWRLDEHRFSEIPTIQIIGAIKTLCIQHSVPYVSQTAQVGKGFFTDERLQSLGMYFQGKKHARDSLRHAAQFLTFGAKSLRP